MEDITAAKKGLLFVEESDFSSFGSPVEYFLSFSSTLFNDFPLRIDANRSSVPDNGGACATVNLLDCTVGGGNCPLIGGGGGGGGGGTPVGNSGAGGDISVHIGGGGEDTLVDISGGGDTPVGIGGGGGGTLNDGGGITVEEVDRDGSCARDATRLVLGLGAIGSGVTGSAGRCLTIGVGCCDTVGGGSSICGGGGLEI